MCLTYIKKILKYSNSDSRPEEMKRHLLLLDRITQCHKDANCLQVNI